MKRILTLLAVFTTVLAMMSCNKDTECKCNCNCNDNTENNDGPGNNGGNTDEIEVINSKLNYGYLENWGLYYDEQPEDVNNWMLYLSVNDFDEYGWSVDGDLVMIELFSKGTDNILAGKYTVEAFLANNFCDFSVGDGYTEEGEDEDGEVAEYCAGTWLFQDDYGVAAALSGECNVKISGQTYTITYNFKDEDYDIVFKGSYTGALDVYDCTDMGYSLASVKSPAPKKIKRQVSPLRF